MDLIREAASLLREFGCEFALDTDKYIIRTRGVIYTMDRKFVLRHPQQAIEQLLEVMEDQ